MKIISLTMLFYIGWRFAAIFSNVLLNLIKSYENDTLLQNSFEPFLCMHIRIFTVKENYISSVASEIFSYTHTDRQSVTFI